MPWRVLVSIVPLLGACGPAVPDGAPARPQVEAPAGPVGADLTEQVGAPVAGAPVAGAPVAGAPVGQLPAESGPRVLAEDTPEHTLDVAGDRALGCGLLPTIRRAFVRRVRVSPDLQGSRRDEGTPVPLRTLRTLEPHVNLVRVIGPDGVCEPRRGAAEVFGWGGEGWAEVSQEMASCPSMSEIAWIDCEPPAWLRYERLSYRIEELPISGESVDPRVRNSVDDLDAIGQYLEADGVDPPAGWRRSLRRRAHIAEVNLGDESFSVVETSWQIRDSCRMTSRTRVAYVRTSGSSEWVRLSGLSGALLGVYHDGRRVLGVEIRGIAEPPASEPCGGTIEGGSDCLSIGFVSRASFTSFEPSVNLYYGFTTGQYDPPDGLQPLPGSLAADCYR